jgi:hypothetical protein
LVEFIDGLAAAAFTEEDFLNDPIRDRMHLCPAGSMMSMASCRWPLWISLKLS